MTKSYIVQDFSAMKKNQMQLAEEHVVFYTEMIFILLYKLL